MVRFRRTSIESENSVAMAKNKPNALFFIGAFALIASVLLALTHAATPTSQNADGTTADQSAVPQEITQGGSYNLSDFYIMRDNFGASGVDSAKGDLNSDGSVDLSDFYIFRQGFGS